MKTQETLPEWLALTPDAAIRPNRHVSEACRQAIPNQSAILQACFNAETGLRDASSAKTIHFNYRLS